MEATYLAWLDCRDAGILGNPSDFFLRKAKVALNDGSEFGKGGEGFVRLNFACPRKTLTEALDRMVSALKECYNKKRIQGAKDSKIRVGQGRPSAPTLKNKDTMRCQLYPEIKPNRPLILSLDIGTSSVRAGSF